jgi:hypothetical protein
LIEVDAIPASFLQCVGARRRVTLRKTAHDCNVITATMIMMADAA